MCFYYNKYKLTEMIEIDCILQKDAKKRVSLSRWNQSIDEIRPHIESTLVSHRSKLAQIRTNECQKYSLWEIEIF